MDRTERDKLYDWLENGKVDIWLRRLMRDRLAELEAGVRETLTLGELTEGLAGQLAELLEYAAPAPLPTTAQDEFDQTAVSLTVPIGGTWGGAGDADVVHVAGETPRRAPRNA